MARAAAIPIPAFAPADRPLGSVSTRDVLVVPGWLEGMIADVGELVGCAAFEEAGVDRLAVVDVEVDVEVGLDVDVLEEDIAVVLVLA